MFIAASLAFGSFKFGAGKTEQKDSNLLGPQEPRSVCDFSWRSYLLLSTLFGLRMHPYISP
jgi:hypothetical protein